MFIESPGSLAILYLAFWHFLIIWGSLEGDNQQGNVFMPPCLQPALVIQGKLYE